MISNTEFELHVSFTGCKFRNVVELEIVFFRSSVFFTRSSFERQTIIEANILREARFESCIFNQSVRFSGFIVWSMPVAGERETDEVSRLFDGEADLTNIYFPSGTQVLFTGVDLSSAKLTGTDFSGTKFQDVSWYQPSLRRSGLYEEVRFFKKKNWQDLRKRRATLEETYRNIRVTLEEDNRNYNEAADFYIGELDARRSRMNPMKRWIFSVEALYRLLSRYGTSPLRATTVLIVLILSHAAITAMLQKGIDLYSVGDLSIVLLRSVRLIVFHIDPTDEVQLTVAQNWSDTLFRIIATIQIALLVFALRGKIKRH
ncbi:MAG: hypothetical protein ABS69_00770 [Nitrosomonadales bacterium SCN 54-20]|nr:MAG: hypothetical protein ABS69_00770 [Nitrosomonadales bacterium SCN 54-20]